MVAEDRRHANTTPPDGVERRCSDEQCIKAREIWFEQTLLPRLRNQMLMALGTAVTVLAAFFLYLSDNAITKFELKIKDEYESRTHHEADIRQVSEAIKEIQNKFESHTQNVIARLDRNLEQIKELKR